MVYTSKDYAEWQRAVTIEEIPLNSAVCTPKAGERLAAGPLMVRGWVIVRGRTTSRYAPGTMRARPSRPAHPRSGTSKATSARHGTGLLSTPTDSVSRVRSGPGAPRTTRERAPRVELAGMDDPKLPAAMSILERIRAVNAASPFNTWAGFEVVSVGDGAVAIALAARPELRQHKGFLHAGVVGALIDTACGFAAASVAGDVLASQNQIVFYAPAAGDRFIVRAKVVKAGKRQVFAAAELFEIGAERERLVAGGSAVLMVVA